MIEDRSCGVAPLRSLAAFQAFAGASRLQPFQSYPGRHLLPCLVI
jgi:hypothetical protein